MTSGEDPRETEAWEREKELPALPAVTGIRRWAIRPGDRLIVTVDRSLFSPEQADHVRDRVRAALRLPDDVRVIVLPRGFSVEVAESP